MSSETNFKWKGLIKVEDTTNKIVAECQIEEPPSQGNLITGFFKKAKKLESNEINKLTIEIKEKGKKVSKGL